MFVNKEEFEEYFGVTPPTNFRPLHDQAVYELQDFCSSLTLDFNEEKPKLALMFQIRHILNNSKSNVVSVRIGQYSETMSTSSQKYDETALIILKSLGCSRWIIRGKQLCKKDF